MLRPATDADLDAIMALEVSSFTTDAWSRDSMARELDSPFCHYLVAVRDGGGLAGYAGLLCPAGSSDADIQTIAVDPADRGQGLGRALMTALMAEAGRRRATQIFLEVRADNPVAHGLYRSLGFDDIAVRPNYYQPDGVDAVVMRAELGRPAGRTTA
ncbi:ribosomal protein S18-alanine N-acetyltransferase [Herbiconiux sp. CPCC 205716]|uniref:Ribosomal protein S18-alanine N-acetyltransferase n=2 Tax=Herbiconiux gentiana TaxID=2970912 RepID=A0ABT2GHT4_9MICO|nr:ribosomal protein S18-alanine N-acetyltransferase [Herbiconiux gentiana]MCS5714825.1 ribosomal protein S18-alanine N-acetyltransferase [Herbiconiux gentiana]